MLPLPQLNVRYLLLHDCIGRCVALNLIDLGNKKSLTLNESRDIFFLHSNFEDESRKSATAPRRVDQTHDLAKLSVGLSCDS